jgi:hypothetical protein
LRDLRAVEFGHAAIESIGNAGDLLLAVYDLSFEQFAQIA